MHNCSMYDDGQFPYADPGSSNQSDCYQNVTLYNASDGTEQCRKYSGYLQQIDCEGVTYDINSAPAGVHKLDNAYYANTRYCSKFPTSVSRITCTEQPDFGNTTATWNGQSWNISACRYYAKDQAGCLWSEKNCYVMAVLKPTATTVADRNTTITYSVIDTHNNVLSTMYNFNTGGYYCTGCVEGSYVADADKQEIDNQQGYIRYPECLSDSSGNAEMFCKCTPAPRGYYLLTGTPFFVDVWGDTMIDWGLNDNPVACPAGQTTTNTGSVGPSSCHYSTDTTFCDTKGCFTLSDIQNWNINLN